MLSFPDASRPTQNQQEALLRLSYLAFVELRALCLDGKAEQAAALAEAFHNLPLMMNRPEFSMDCQRAAFARYGERFGFREGYDYVAKIKEIAGMKG